MTRKWPNVMNSSRETDIASQWQLKPIIVSCLIFSISIISGKSTQKIEEVTAKRAFSLLTERKIEIGDGIRIEEIKGVRYIRIERCGEKCYLLTLRMKRITSPDYRLAKDNSFPVSNLKLETGNELSFANR